MLNSSEIKVGKKYTVDGFDGEWICILATNFIKLRCDYREISDIVGNYNWRPFKEVKQEKSVESVE